jgi:uncharacterized protein (TIGR03000 family)
MFRTKAKCLLFVAVVGMVITIGTTSAEARWGWAAYSYCCSPCWTDCCAPSCGGWYVGVRPGPVRRAVFGPYRWYYGGWGSYSTCCWDPCCTWSCCCTGDPSCGCGEVTVYPAAPGAPGPAINQPTPADPQKKPAETPKPAEGGIPGLPPLPGPGAPAPEPKAGSAGTQDPTRADSGLLAIYVPAEAKVFINGLETKSTGSRRQYVSYGLTAGYRYKYEVAAQIVRDGKILEETKTVYLTAGAKEGVAFGFNAKPAEGLAATE